MSRKRWMTTVWPSATSQRHQSQAATYRFIASQREDKAAGLIRTEQIVVRVSDSKGLWQVYERITL